MHPHGSVLVDGHYVHILKFFSQLLGFSFVSLFQVDLLLSFCQEMKFTSVVLVGHDDGALLALKAAERLQSSQNSGNVC